jgi:hypothetical protein
MQQAGLVIILQVIFVFNSHKCGMYHIASDDHGSCNDFNDGTLFIQARKPPLFQLTIGGQ